MQKEYEIHYELKESLNYLEIDQNYFYLKFITPISK